MSCMMLTIISGQGKPHWPSKMQGILNMSLQQWRRSLPEVMQWKDHDPPSKDINVARMRAKYYGACYIIHRPLLYYALHIAKRPASVESPPTAAQVGGQVTYSDLPLKVQHACKVCVISAIRSTEAFDGIEGRLVVTNIFGTAHAYDSRPDLLKLTG